MAQETTPYLGAPMPDFKPTPPLEDLGEPMEPGSPTWGGHNGLGALVSAVDLQLPAYTTAMPRAPRPVARTKGSFLLTDEGTCWRADGKLTGFLINYLIHQPPRPRPAVLNVDDPRGCVYTEHGNRRAGRPAGRIGGGQNVRDIWRHASGSKRKKQSDGLYPTYGVLTLQNGENVRFLNYTSNNVTIYHIVPDATLRPRAAPCEPACPPPGKVAVRSAGHKGNGVFATCDILPQDELWLPYLGTQYDQEEGERRFDAFSAAHPGDARYDPEYVIQLPDGDFVESVAPHCVAATINHSTTPNTEFLFNMGKLWVQVTKPIAMGEELTVDYGENWLGFDERSRFFKGFTRNDTCGDFTLPTLKEWM